MKLKFPSFGSQKKINLEIEKQIVKEYVSQIQMASAEQQQKYVDFVLGQKMSGKPISTIDSIIYYATAAPVCTAIDIIIENFAALQPILKNTKTSKYVDDHPVLDLLYNPNSFGSRSSFMEQFSGMYLIDGNSYLIGDSSTTSSSPISISVANNLSVNYVKNQLNGSVAYYTVDVGDVNAMKFVSRMVNKRLRYYSSIGVGSHELYHVKNFNPTSCEYQIKGMSKMTGIGYELEQYVAASTHNLSLLKRGATLSGILFGEGNIPQIVIDSLREQVNQKYSGATNAGKIMLAHSGFNKFIQTGQTNKDMDFKELKKAVSEEISKRYKVPLPLVISETMSMSNFQNSMTALYHNAIIPLATKLYEELTLFLMPYYENSANLVITFDESSISALLPEKIETLKNKQTLGVLTANEIRKELNYDPLKSDGDNIGADALYQSSTLIPYAYAKKPKFDNDQPATQPTTEPQQEDIPPVDTSQEEATQQNS